MGERGRTSQERLKEQTDEIQRWLDEQVNKVGDMDVTPLDVATLLTTAREDQVKIERLEGRLADIAELLEEVMIEQGARHAVDCDKDLDRGAPCSCGYASLVKARRAAAMR